MSKLNYDIYPAEAKSKFDFLKLNNEAFPAEAKQKWPLLNLVRQILKSNNYNMEPIRKSNGYTKEGKKKYLRFFIIKKIKSTKAVEVEVN